MPDTNYYHTAIQMGATFLCPSDVFLARLSGIKVFVFDWDGVFNQGIKGEGIESNFSEVDSMGLNLLRFGYWLKNNRQIPITGIITGMNNASAHLFAQRENFNFIFSGFKHKSEAIEQICNKYSITSDQIAFTFDDVLDISAASICKLRFLVQHKASVRFTNYMIKNNYADYLTANDCNQFAIREICELILDAWNIFSETLTHRAAYSPDYIKFISTRNAITPLVFKK